MKTTTTKPVYSGVYDLGRGQSCNLAAGVELEVISSGDLVAGVTVQTSKGHLLRLTTKTAKDLGLVE
jgi:hypothetical protein